jgi:hypothetical protein
VNSSVLDNIAGALIGGAMAHQLFRAKVHIGYLAAIVAASNARGAWSVLGDTTTRMMWIAGISPARLFQAIIASTVALFIFGIPAAIQQHKHSPILKSTHAHPRRLDACRHRRADSCARDRDQRDGESEVHRAGRSLSVYWDGSASGDSAIHPGGLLSPSLAAAISAMTRRSTPRVLDYPCRTWKPSR